MSSIEIRLLRSRALAAALVFAAWPCASQAAEHASAGTEANAPPASAPIGPQDPMEMLRERLQQKLGVLKSPDPKNPNLVRVETQSHGPAPKENDHAPAPHHAVRHSSASDAASHGAGSVRWDYSGSGNPNAWAKLSPEFGACATGSRQSPIDIRDGIKVDLEPIKFSYQPSGFRVIDDGHTVQVKVSPGNFIEVTGRRYELVDFHFHRPSEELVDGKRFDMVAHLVHKDAQGHVAVVAVLLESGGAQAVVQSVWNNLPLEKGDEVPASGSLDLNGLLPTARAYFTYMGSLTTPPCTEGVLWMVMKQPVPVSPEQIAVFSRLYPMNARPVQPMGDRLIKESN